MSPIDRSNSRRPDSQGSSRGPGGIPRILCTVMILAILPLSGGCSPEAMVATIIVAPVLYAHLRQHQVATRQPPATPLTKPYVSASLARHSIMCLDSTPSESQCVSATPAHDSTMCLDCVSPEPQSTTFPIRQAAAADHEPADRLPACSPAANGTVSAPKAYAPLVRKVRLPPPDEPAVSPSEAAASAYREMHWEEAAQILREALAAGTCPDAELGKAHLLLGAMAYQQGDVEVARRHFEEAHLQDSRMQPSPQLFPPQLIQFYRSASSP